MRDLPGVTLYMLFIYIYIYMCVCVCVCVRYFLTFFALEISLTLLAV